MIKLSKIVEGCPNKKEMFALLSTLNFRQLYLEPGLGASEGEELHSELENPLEVSVFSS